MRSLPLLAALVVAACAGPPDDYDESYGDLGDAVPEVGGLSADEVRRLQSLGVPVLVPGDPGAFELATIEANADPVSESYRLSYRRADGACFEVSGATDGFGGPGFPLVSTDVTIRSLGRRVRLYKAADDPAASSAQIWGVETVVSDFIELERPGGPGIVGVLFLSDTQGGCRPVSLEEGADLVADLRLLTPSGASPEPLEPSAFGDFAPADDLLTGANQASSPALAADAIARRYDGAARDVRVETIGETDREARVLVTALGLPDDSIRDERLLLTYRPLGGSWSLVDAGRQVRCQTGRGHQDWRPDACL